MVALHFRPGLESLRSRSLTGTQAFIVVKGVTTRNAPKPTALPGHQAMTAPERAETGKFGWPVRTDGTDRWCLPVPLPCSLRSGAARNHVSSTWCGTGICKELCSSWSRLALAPHGADGARPGVSHSRGDSVPSSFSPQALFQHSTRRHRVVRCFTGTQRS